MENIIENNKLIAEFRKEEKYLQSTEYLVGNVIYSENNLRYHISWDWLMPVVEQISKIKSWSLNATLEWLSESQERDGLYSIEDVYQAVVEFIKWYNKNKSTC